MLGMISLFNLLSSALGAFLVYQEKSICEIFACLVYVDPSFFLNLIFRLEQTVAYVILNMTERGRL